jgi:hypothetical protein
MLLIPVVGIPLIIVAWKRGWKGWALLPIALAVLTSLLIGFIWGFIVGPEAGTEAYLEEHNTEFILIELLSQLTAFAVLIAMIAKPRRQRGAIEQVGSRGVSSARAFCPECGLEQVGDANFCRSCGARIRLYENQKYASKKLPISKQQSSYVQ